MQPRLRVSRTLRFIGGPKNGQLETIEEWYEGKTIVCHTLKPMPIGNEYPDAQVGIEHHEYRCGQTNAEYVGKQ